MFFISSNSQITMRVKRAIKHQVKINKFLAIQIKKLHCNGMFFVFLNSQRSS